MESKYPLVFLAGPFNGAVMAMFHGMGFRGTNDLMLADFVVFTGGSDIDPAIYQHQRIKECGNPDVKRDHLETAVFKAARNFGIPMVGICRGAQLLNALSGGTLYQHTDGHIGTHWAADTRTGKRMQVTSTHHQMMMPSQAGEVIAIACPAKDDEKKEVVGSLATIKKADGLIARPKADDYDVEVVWYEDTKCLCFQPHPEYQGAGGTSTRGYFIELLDELILNAADKEKVA